MWERIYNPNFNYGEFATIKNPLEFEGVRPKVVKFDHFVQGVEFDPLRNRERRIGMTQRDRLIELNKIAIQQMKVLEGVEERRMLK